MDKVTNAFKVAEVLFRYVFGIVQGLFWSGIVAVGILDIFTAYDPLSGASNNEFIMLTLLIWGCAVWALLFRMGEQAKAEKS